MPAIHIRDIPEDVLAALKRRAARNSRSLQMEIKHHLFLLAEEPPGIVPFRPLKLVLSDVEGSSTWSRDEIYGDDGR